MEGVLESEEAPRQGDVCRMRGLAEELSKTRATDEETARLALAELERLMSENEGLHAQLVAQAHEAGVADERQRLAREIHDTVAQGLMGVITQLEAARAAAGPARDRRIENAVLIARESLAEARRAVRAATPVALEGRSLPEALAQVKHYLRNLRFYSNLLDVPFSIEADAPFAASFTGIEVVADAGGDADAMDCGVAAD